MKINSVLLAGAGAVGLTVAETIYNYDPACISILAKEERLERYRKNGLKVNGNKPDFRFVQEKKSDLIIVACKFYHLKQIIEDIAPSVDKDTVILSLLNGISSEEIIGAKFGLERLPLAMILGTDAFHKAEETNFTHKGVIHFGDRDGKNGEKEQAIAEFFDRAGVAYKLEANMKRSLWYKFMLNVGVNQVTAVLRLPYGAISNKGGPDEIPEARDLIDATAREVVAVANAEGIDLGEEDVKSWVNTVTNLNPSGFTSMCQDVLAKRKTEAEMFSLTVTELARKHGIPVPVNETLYKQIRAIEQSYHLTS